MKLLFVFIILFSSSSLVYADLESDIEDLNNEGRKFFALGELEKAISYFDQALEIDK